MNRTREKQQLENELRTVRKLAAEYPEGATARNIRELEDDLVERIAALPESS